jgi:hypothetical protein
VLGEGRGFFRFLLEGASICFLLRVKLFKDVSSTLLLIGEKSVVPHDQLIKIYF